MIDGRRAAKSLVGKTIAFVDLRAFDAMRAGERRGRNSFDPMITFTDGTRLTFNVQETETGEYGVNLNLHPLVKP